MNLSRLDRSEALGALASLVLIGSLFLKWFGLSGQASILSDQHAWVCGTNEYSCSAFDTFPILRWLLIAAASAPLILAWIVIRGHKLSWPPGQLTMVVGLTATVLVLYNGVIGRPGAIRGAVDLSYGYLIGLLAAIGIAVAGIWRSYQSGGAPQRRPPGTF
jgi:hypothetical protein